MSDLLREFLTETHESLDVVDSELVRFEREPNNAQILSHIFRLVHTIKGTCGFIGLPRLEALTHAAETLMGKFRDGMPVSGDAVSLILSVIDRIKEILGELDRHGREPEGDDSDLIWRLDRLAHGDRDVREGRTVGTLVDQTLERPLRHDEVSLDELERAFREAPGPDPEIAAKGDERRGGERREDERRDGFQSRTLRVQVETLERLMTMVSELVLTRNQMQEIMRRAGDGELNAPFQRLSTITGQLQEGVMKTRMQPIGNAWAKLPRIVRDLAAELGKKIQIEMRGEDTELDRQLLEIVRDPLTHMVRNSADHGIESPAGRRAVGKPEEGTIRLSAFQEGGHVIVEIADDGRGLDAANIRKRAVRVGLVSQAEADRLSDAQVFKFIFAPGFSTAAEVTSVSGRGVGMDVVKSNIDQIGGSIDLRSTRGQGTTVRIKIPLTLAIVPALIVVAGGERFAIPQIAIDELVHIDAGGEHRVEYIKQAPVLRLRDRLLPLVDLTALMRLEGGQEAERYVVVLQVGNRSFGLVVDNVLQTEEIVVKPMSSVLRDLGVFAGNTILGDGSVIMILDPNGVAAATGSGADTSAIVEERPATAAAEDRNPPTPLLVFHAGSDEWKAVPLSLVTRLEEVDAGRIETSGTRLMIQYRGALMPLLPVDSQVQVRSEGKQPVLVFADRDRSMGLVVDEIVDVIEERLEIQVASRVPGVLGSAIVKGRATEIVDVAHFLPLAYEDWLHRSDMVPEALTRRLLLVDDSAFFRNLMTPVLRAAGYEVMTAASAAEALAMLDRDNRFDFVISDIEMPELNGFDLAERLRASPGTARLNLIALSSSQAPAALERARLAGFASYVAKFDRPGLLAALRVRSADLAKAA